jgi:hypothetical protein
MYYINIETYLYYYSYCTRLMALSKSSGGSYHAKVCRIAAFVSSAQSDLPPSVVLGLLRAFFRLILYCTGTKILGLPVVPVLPVVPRPD